MLLAAPQAKQQTTASALSSSPGITKPKLNQHKVLVTTSALQKIRKHCTLHRRGVAHISSPRIACITQLSGCLLQSQKAKQQPAAHSKEVQSSHESAESDTASTNTAPQPMDTQVGPNSAPCIIRKQHSRNNAVLPDIYAASSLYFHTQLCQPAYLGLKKVMVKPN